MAIEAPWISFADRIGQIVDRGLIALREAQAADDAFRRGWNTARGLVRAAWAEAERVIASSRWEVAIALDPKDGEDHLVLDVDGGRHVFKLIFSPDRARKAVACSTSEPLAGFVSDRIGLEGFIAGKFAEDLIASFVEAVLGHLANR